MDFFNNIKEGNRLRLFFTLFKEKEKLYNSDVLFVDKVSDITFQYCFASGLNFEAASSYVDLLINGGSAPMSPALEKYTITKEPSIKDYAKKLLFIHYLKETSLAKQSRDIRDWKRTNREMDRQRKLIDKIYKEVFT